MLKAAFVYPLAEKVQKRVIRPKLRILRAEASLPFAGRKALAMERLVHTLRHAKNTAPYYRDLFAQHGFDPESVRKDIRYIEGLPYLTKDILREQGRRLVSEPYAGSIVREQKTGSSTGLAATAYYDQEALDWTAAQNILMLEWGGKRRYDREAHLSTRFAAPPPEALRFEAKKCFVLNRCNIYTDGFDDASQERLLDDLRRAEAVVVQGHPSSLFALARYLDARGEKAPGLFSIFVSTGEMLTAKQRSLIENVFSVQVSNRYGACEFGVMAQELACGPKGELLVSDSLVWPEVAADGELVFTGLRNEAMPLIRYRMGDMGVLQEREDGWWVTELTGRVHDAVEIGGVAYPTHYVQDILDRCGPVSDFQIAMRAGTAAELRLVVPVGDWNFVEGAVREQFPSLPVRRIEPEELVFVGVRGKFSYLVREGG
jgi:phenylacetate-CoA ligase